LGIYVLSIRSYKYFSILKAAKMDKLFWLKFVLEYLWDLFLENLSHY